MPLLMFGYMYHPNNSTFKAFLINEYFQMYLNSTVATRKAEIILQISL